MTRILLLSLPWTFLLFSSCIQKEKLAPTEGFKSPIPPKRVMILVFDQMRPDFVERFGLKNFQWLEKNGLRFPNAYVGHLGSLTVVSHAVISTGVLPKNLPWCDDVMKDVDGILGKKNMFYSMVDLTQDQYFKLLERQKTKSLAYRLKTAPYPPPKESPKPGTPPATWGDSLAIGQKFYATMVFGGSEASHIVTLGPKRAADPLRGWREPVGWNVPSFFLEPFGGRFFIDSNPTYESQGTLYPMDGNRFYPGRDRNHQGGDDWVKDGVLQFMEETPQWRAVFATFGSIDKVLHMLGEHTSPTTEAWAQKEKLTLKDTLERADEALGQILETLRTKNLLKETLLIVTSDHGGQHNSSFHGRTAAGAGSPYFEFGKGVNFQNEEMAPALKPIVQTGLVEVSTQDSMIRLWLKKSDRVGTARIADKMRTVPGIAEIYSKQRTGKSYHYIRTYRSPELTDRALEWAKEHDQELVETMASAGSPDVLGLLLDGHGYALIGEHGGAQEEVQRIPFYLFAPNLKTPTEAPQTAVRLVDVNPIVEKLLGLSSVPDLDGSSRAIEGLVQ